MDLNFLREPAMLIFTVAMLVEFIVTAKLFIHRENVNVSQPMKYWAIITLVLMSAWNGNAAYEVYNNPALGEALITKLGYCVIGMSLLCWVWVFHLDKWGIKIKKTAK